MEHTNLYANTSFEEIKQKLYKEIQSALYKKYGKNPDPLVLKRVKDEWNFLKKYHSIEDAWKEVPNQQAIGFIAFMHDLGRWLRHHNYPYWSRGTGASSFILYLLDVTFINPLPAHYHCPHCHRIYWKTDEYKDGFDLPPTAKCKYDNTPLIADGHNIPWQSLFRYPTHAFHFDIDTVETAKTHALIFLENCWLGKLNPNIEHTIPHPQACPSIIWYDNLTLDCSIKGSYQDFFTTHIDNTCRKITLRAWNDILNSDISNDTPELPEPCTFADLVYNLGLNSSTGVWNDDAKFMIEHFGYSTSDLIAYRDDIFHYLTDHHITQRKAYVIADQIRRGFLTKELPMHLTLGRDKWILNYIKRIEYLFPKAHTLEWIFFLLKTRIKNEQKVYEKPYIAKDINVDIPYNLGKLPITKKDLHQLPTLTQQMVELFYSILEKYYRNVHMNIPIPNIIISTEVPEEIYGEIPFEIITYDFDEVLSKHEETIPLLAKYDYKQNNITLYIENIYQHFRQAPDENLADKLKAGLEISLAHAICNAITFYFVAETQSQREKLFDKELDDYDCREFLSELKGLGRWFEYVWCKQNISKSDIYKWRINQIKDEALTFSPKHWPYAESKNILLTDEGNFLEDKFANGEAMCSLKNFSKRKDVLYWDEVDYQ